MSWKAFLARNLQSVRIMADPNAASSAAARCVRSLVACPSSFVMPAHPIAWYLAHPCCTERMAYSTWRRPPVRLAAAAERVAECLSSPPLPQYLWRTGWMPRRMSPLPTVSRGSGWHPGPQRLRWMSCAPAGRQGGRAPGLSVCSAAPCRLLGALCTCAAPCVDFRKSHNLHSTPLMSPSAAHFGTHDMPKSRCSTRASPSCCAQMAAWSPTCWWSMVRRGRRSGGLLRRYCAARTFARLEGRGRHAAPLPGAPYAQSPASCHTCLAAASLLLVPHTRHPPSLPSGPSDFAHKVQVELAGLTEEGIEAALADAVTAGNTMPRALHQSVEPLQQPTVIE